MCIEYIQFCPLAIHIWSPWWLAGWLATARPTNTVTVIFGSSPDNSQHPQTLTFASNTTQTAYNNQVSKSAPTAILLLMSVLKSPGKITLLTPPLLQHTMGGSQVPGLGRSFVPRWSMPHYTSDTYDYPLTIGHLSWQCLSAQPPASYL